MTTVRFTAWQPGLNKVALTKLVRESGDLRLDEAHELVNRLLEGQRPEIRVGSDQDAEKLAREARALGASTECVSETPTASAAS